MFPQFLYSSPQTIITINYLLSADISGSNSGMIFSPFSKGSGSFFVNRRSCKNQNHVRLIHNYYTVSYPSFFFRLRSG